MPVFTISSGVPDIWRKSKGLGKRALRQRFSPCALRSPNPI